VACNSQFGSAEIACGFTARRAEAAYRVYGNEVQRRGRAAGDLPKGAAFQAPERRWRRFQWGPPLLRVAASLGNPIVWRSTSKLAVTGH
jgi:hypothetical protein